MLVRESDIHLHRSVEMTSNQDPIGVPSIGVKRLLWFDLVMTAYLDASGRLDPSNRTIDMVYYDIRDIEFEDVGLSPRMLDAVHHLGKEVGFTRFESLSDILVVAGLPRFHPPAVCGRWTSTTGGRPNLPQTVDR